MIHSGHGEEVVSTISAHLTAESEVVKHGAALGVGLAAMATANEGKLYCSILIQSYCAIK